MDNTRFKAKVRAHLAGESLTWQIFNIYSKLFPLHLKKMPEPQFGWWFVIRHFGSKY